MIQWRVQLNRLPDVMMMSFLWPKRVDRNAIEPLPWLIYVILPILIISQAQLNQPSLEWPSAQFVWICMGSTKYCRQCAAICSVSHASKASLNRAKSVQCVIAVSNQIKFTEFSSTHKQTKTHKLVPNAFLPIWHIRANLLSSIPIVYTNIHYYCLLTIILTFENFLK